MDNNDVESNEIEEIVGDEGETINCMLEKLLASRKQEPTIDRQWE